ncbi:MAG: DUF1232 domain-containing protein [Anaerolineae bacterium]|jgi:uncharacterized membrane protein YkvA (DUF1232 family)|nr:DUF1232 domain-containing protein [Anaerolineae bacterium]
MKRTLKAWQRRAHQLKIELHALALAYRDPRVPWYARLFALCVIGYAFSPLDLIPDPIPVLGYLDDLILVPLGIALALRLIPPQVMSDCREQARTTPPEHTAAGWIAAGLIVLVWLLLAALVARLVA